MTEATNMVLKVQSVLYNTSPLAIIKFFGSLAVCDVPKGYKVLLHLGDCTERNTQRHPVKFWEEEGILHYWKAELAKSNIEFEYTYFDDNLGPAKGHNTLWKEHPVEGKLLIINPDTVFPHHLLTRLVKFANQHPDYGVIEARQIPLEHPKEVDPVSYKTGWISTACALFNIEAFEKVKGFDETFFMYCDDVDISWRLRAAGYGVYSCLETFVYHSKRLTAYGVEMSWAEQHYGLIYSMVLRAKYGKAELNEPVLNWLKNAGNTAVLEAYNAALRKMSPATPAQIAAAYFAEDGEFAKHRWKYQPYKAGV